MRRVGVSLFKFLPPVFICLACVLVYSNTFHASYHLDDEVSILANYTIRNLANLKAVWNFWPGRFLTYFSLAADYALGGLSLPLYHLTNLAIHLGTGILAWWLILLTFSTPGMRGSSLAGRGRIIALAGGLLFVCHPVQTQAVTYIIQRAAALAAFFYLLSLSLYAKARLGEKLSPGYYAGSLAAAAAALFSKEPAATLPLVVLLYELFFFKDGLKAALRRLWPFFLLTLSVLLLLKVTEAGRLVEMKTLGVAGATKAITAGSYLLTQLRVIVTYLRLLLLPINQNLDYNYPIVHTLWSLPTLASLGLILLLLAWGVLLFRRHRLLSFSIFFFFLTLLPESSFIPIKDVIFEHRLYLPLFGYALFLPAGIFCLAGKWKKTGIVTILLIALVAGYGVMTYNRNRVWRDDITLWSDVIKKAPGKARAHWSLGVAYTDQKQYAMAIDELNKALALDPENPGPIHSLGMVYYNMGDYDRALGEYAEAVRIDPGYERSYLAMGFSHAAKGELDKAISDWTQTIRLNPYNAAAFYNRGCAHYRTGNDAGAISDYSRALQIDPGYAEAYFNRGVAYAREGKIDESIADWTRTVRLQPDHVDAYRNRAVSYYLKKEYDLAWKDVQKVRSLGFEVNPGLLRLLQQAYRP